MILFLVVLVWVWWAYASTIEWRFMNTWSKTISVLLASVFWYGIIYFLIVALTALLKYINT